MNLIAEILKNPHLLGHSLGYTDLTFEHSKWIKKVWLSKSDITLQAHRGSYKTTSCVVVGCIWFLLFNPNARILICRKEHKISTDVLKEISSHFRGEVLTALIKQIYGHDLYLKTDASDRLELSIKTKVSKEPNIMTIGIGGSVTGMHFDKVITDDIVTVKDRISLAERKATKVFYEELINVVDPGNPIYNFGTPWHKDDCFSIMPKAKKYPIGSIKIKSFTKKHILKLKSILPPDVFAINYLLKHSESKNKIFKNPRFGKVPERWEPVAHVDKAYKGKDTIALSMLGEFGGQLYGYGKTWKGHINEHYNDIADLMRDKRAGTLWTETNDDKGMSTIEFQKRGVIVGTYHESRNKHVKITGYLYPKWTSIVWCEDTDEEYLLQICEYEEGKEPDDCADSLASLISQMGEYNSDEMLSIYKQT